jgi:dUTP pyrophosphatase
MKRKTLHEQEEDQDTKGKSKRLKLEKQSSSLCSDSVPTSSSPPSASTPVKENTTTSNSDNKKSNNLLFKVKKLSTLAHLPQKGSPGSAGYDLHSAYDYKVPARGKEMVKTDLAISVPQGTYGRIAPRSGLAWKNSIDVGAGVIDRDYTGNVQIVLYNHSNDDFVIKAGNRVAQLILEKIVDDAQLVEIKEDLDITLRNSGGFGSTGM